MQKLQLLAVLLLTIILSGCDSAFIMGGNSDSHFLAKHGKLTIVNDKNDVKYCVVKHDKREDLTHE